MDAALELFRPVRWDQSFEPGENAHGVRYLPRFQLLERYHTRSFPEIEPGRSAAKTYCIDDALRRAFHRKPRLELYSVTHKIPCADGMECRFATGSWSTRRRTLTCLVSARCARKISPTTFAWTATRHTPGAQRVLFFIDPMRVSRQANGNDHMARRIQLLVLRANHGCDAAPAFGTPSGLRLRQGNNGQDRQGDLRLGHVGSLERPHGQCFKAR